MLFLLITFRLGTCEVRHLTQASLVKNRTDNPTNQSLSPHLEPAFSIIFSSAWIG